MTTQPAGEHHTGTLDLAGEGNAPEHQPVGIRSTDVGPFVRCSCGSNPTPKHWLDTHWPGDKAEGMRLVEDLVAAARTPISDEIVQLAERAYETFGAGMQDALEAAYPAIRQQVAEQIADKANEIAEQFQATAISQRDLSHEHGRTIKGTSHMNTAHAYRNKADGAWAAAHAAREIGGEA